MFYEYVKNDKELASCFAHRSTGLVPSPDNFSQFQEALLPQDYRCTGSSPG